MSFDYQSYLLGKYSAEKLVKTIEDILCCEDDSRDRKECRFGLARAAPYIISAASRGDCDEVDRLLNLFFAWYGVRWVAMPCGEDPDTKQQEIRMILCSGSLVLDEEYLLTIGQQESGLSINKGEAYE